MKVLLVHNYYQQPGGEDLVFQAEAELLKSQGHKVVEIVEDNKELKDINRVKVAVNAVWSRQAYQKIRSLVRDVKPDIVHFHNTLLRISPAAYYACKKEGVPVVQTLHNYRMVCPGALLMRNGQVCEDCLGKSVPWASVVHGCWRGTRAQTAVVAGILIFHRLLKTWQKQVDLYIALTEFSRRKFIEGGLPAEKIVVKPNFIHPDPGVGEGYGTYALFVGRLSSEKGLWMLIRAWQRLKDVPLKVVGDGPLLEEIREFVHDRKGVEVLGRRSHDEVLALMKGARLLVFPSEWYEGFPMTIAEAFACGLPVVASRLGAMAEIVEDGYTGLLFEPGNAEDLASKVAWAWTRQEEMAKMGQESRRKYEEKYTPEQNYKMLMAIYEKVINDK